MVYRSSTFKILIDGMTDESSNGCLLLFLLILLLPVAAAIGLLPRPRTFSDFFDLVILVLILFFGFLLLVGTYRACDIFDTIDKATRQRWSS